MNSVWHKRDIREERSKMKTFALYLFLILGTGMLCAEEKIKAVLFPFREAVISSRVDSRTGKYCFRLGESFPADAVLVELDKENYDIKLKLANNQLEFAKASFLDKQELRKRNFTSDFELKKAEYEFRTAESNLAVARLNYSYCSIRAPFAGKIVEFITREYETVRAGQQLFRIIDDNFLLAVANIPLEKVQKVGSTKTFLLQNGMKVQGKIYEITPQADHRTGTVRVRILIDNRAGKLNAGMTGVLDNDK